MKEVVFTAPDHATLVVAATACNMTTLAGMDADDGPAPLQIMRSGLVPGGGSWFYNYVGVANDLSGTPLPGVWGRLRVNGEVLLLPGIIVACIANGVTIYQEVFPEDGSAPFWSSDGGTPAPDYVSAIGAIA